ncbi:hypothetical protein [Sphingomonas glacialis]|uniref:hypothetical protein n=1 Tax=Sphingomonas glacialis TaxID=658225 RepID=UPI00112DCECD|nr:hypothetical protein [Sphingomonas glacialis]
MLILAMAVAITQASPGAIEPPRPGTITVDLSGEDPVWEDRGEAADDDPFVRATRDALGYANFLVLPPGIHSRYIASVEVSQQERGSVAADGVEAKPAGNIGNWGGGVRITLPSKKTNLRALIITRLDIKVRLRSDGQLVWSGSALTAQVEGTGAGSIAALGVKLANAVVSQFPLTVEVPISVP